jgi:Tol biopolymer transport system component
VSHFDEKFIILCVTILIAGSSWASDVVVSKLGFVAKVTRVPNLEGGTKTVIWKGKKIIATISDTAISFSPDGRVLLMAESGPDDDSRYFLLNIAGGEYSKDPERRLDWIIGSRWVRKSSWSKDSRYVFIYDNEEMVKSSGPVRYTVSKYIAPSSKLGSK